MTDTVTYEFAPLPPSPDDCYVSADRDGDLALACGACDRAIIYSWAKEDRDFDWSLGAMITRAAEHLRSDCVKRTVEGAVVAPRPELEARP